MSSQTSKGEIFRQLHARTGLFAIPNPWDAGSAKILAALGFEALATTSAGFAYSIGKPDGEGAITRDETLANAKAIVDATRLPVSADLENGFGDTPQSCAETISMAAGIGGGSMSVELWLAFVAASAILLIIPGPTILTVISYSVAHGRRANVPLVTAVALGDSTALVLSLLGLGALLKASAFWFTAIKWTGGLYLIYLGIKLLRAGMNAADVAAPAAPDSRWRLFANTYAVTALNPKGMIFFVAFLPQFLNPGTEVAPQLWVLAVTFVALATLNATLYAVFAATARRVLTSPRAQRRFHLAGGSLLSAAGAWALLARRAG